VYCLQAAARLYVANCLNFEVSDSPHQTGMIYCSSFSSNGIHYTLHLQNSTRRLPSQEKTMLIISHFHFTQSNSWIEMSFTCQLGALSRIRRPYLLPIDGKTTRLSLFPACGWLARCYFPHHWCPTSIYHHLNIDLLVEWLNGRFQHTEFPIMPFVPEDGRVSTFLVYSSTWLTY
jgi:hypothetical protein